MSEKEDFFDQLERFTAACKKLHANVERAKAATSEQDAIARAEGWRAGQEAMRDRAAKACRLWHCGNCGSHFQPHENCTCDRPDWRDPLTGGEIESEIRALPLEPGAE